MPTYKIDSSEVDMLGRALGIDLTEIANRAILAAAQKVVQRATTVVIPAEPRPPVDRRIYAAGFKAKPLKDGALVQNTAPHASIVEYGARAENIKIGRKMIDALAAWIIRKGIVQKGRGAKGKEEAEKKARQIAWAIALNMKAKGIFNEGKGLRILEKALKGVDEDFSQELKREIGREFKG